MTRRDKLWTLALSGVAIVALIFLSAGLSELEFSPGGPLPQREAAEVLYLTGSGSPLRNPLGEMMITALFIISQLLLPASIIYFLLSPEARKRVLKSLGFLLWLPAIYLLLRARPDIFEPAGRAIQELPFLDGDLPTAEFVASPPRWLAGAITVCLAILIASAIVKTVRSLWLHSRRPASPLEKLALEAQEAIEALQAGTDLRDTVIRCYYEMSCALSKERGLVRREAMTPREFERHLREAGIPGEPVRRLTRLFERVRYGDQALDQEKEEEAITYLTFIVEACKNQS